MRHSGVEKRQKNRAQKMGNILKNNLLLSEAYLEPCQTCKMERFLKIPYR